ncbi:hypothetical protein MP228_001073 [Amoeboaphelidium protococcarum]|nr:hypothetical protein MP228_001073 [Amoeboaphelidium protococcarum]
MSLLIRRTHEDGTEIDPSASSKDLQLVATFLRSYTTKAVISQETGSFGKVLKQVSGFLTNIFNGTYIFGLGNGGPKVLKVREGILSGLRVEYFKGEKAVNAMMTPEYTQFVERKGSGGYKKTDDSDSVLRVYGSKDEAAEVVRSLMENNFIFRVSTVRDEESEKVRDKKVNGMKVLEISQNQTFTADSSSLYVWQYDPPHVKTLQSVKSGLFLLLVLVLVMFPLWPHSLRISVWYLSMTGVGFIVALLVIAIIRFIIYVISLAIPWTRPGLWIFPNLFADVGVIDSFIPLYGWSGINYEKMHIEKYKKQSKKMSKKGKKSKQSSPEKASTSQAAGGGKQSGGSIVQPLIEEIKDGSSSIGAVKDSTDDENVEEIIMDSQQ